MGRDIVSRSILYLVAQCTKAKRGSVEEIILRLKMSIAGASGLWKPHKQHLCLHQRSTGKKAGRRLTTTTPEGKFFFSVCRASSQRREVGVGVRGRKKADTDFDIVVVGAGIIGLTIANRILTTTNLSVAIVDAAQPCAGATGAGTSLCVPLCLCNVCSMCFFVPGTN
jgi:hypothetical protein